MRLCLKFLMLSVCASAPLPAADADHTAQITRFFGKAQLLTAPAPRKAGEGPHVLFEELYYHAEPARIGSKVPLGSVIQTGEKTMVRLVYPNGDQIMISPSSSYRVTMEKQGDKEKPISELIYGKFRAVISKEGPRHESEVRTKTMVMGIRGTDFHVEGRTENGGSAVTVLRGVVAVTPTTATAGSAPQTLNVPSGSRAAVATAAPVQVAVADKIDLRSIQVTQSAFKDSEATTDAAIQKEVAALESKAVETTRKDIQTGDPDLYKRLEAAEAKGKRIDSIEVLQAVTLEKAIVRAPEPPAEKVERLEKAGIIPKRAAPPKKPTQKELDELEGGIYDRYFKQ